ncbi:MAG TPA: diacylglycerol kinase family protein [Candidatus Limnocylindrales bacterium]|nr:diacylglycerol kinase family protein [Candidatus Limnocylindrales bacterium]
MTAVAAIAAPVTPRTDRRILVVWNPAAGLPTTLRGGNVDDLRDTLETHGIQAQIAVPHGEDEAHDVVRRAVSDGFDVVVAAGGDGTVHLVAEDLLGTQTALGILPLGRVMNVARALGIERDMDAAAEVLVTGEIRAIDTGEATAADGRVVPFFEAGSVGLNAAIFAEVTRADEGDPVSILRTVGVAFRYRPARMTIELDEGRISSRALMVAVSNGPYLGLGMTVAPTARLDDGRFDVRVFRHFSKLELLRHLASIAFGRRQYAPHVSTYRSARVRITSVHPLPARADGVDLGTTPVSYGMRAGSLRVVVPASQSTTASSTDGSDRRRM